jgi:hypothetical protein
MTPDVTATSTVAVEENTNITFPCRQWKALMIATVPIAMLAMIIRHNVTLNYAMSN